MYDQEGDVDPGALLRVSWNVQPSFSSISFLVSSTNRKRNLYEIIHAFRGGYTSKFLFSLFRYLIYYYALNFHPNHLE